MLGRAQLAAAQAQTAADLAALSAGRELRARLGEVALDGPASAAGSGARGSAAVAAAAAAPAGARVEALRFPERRLAARRGRGRRQQPRGRGGPRARAMARAGLVVPALADGGPTGWATGRRLLGPAALPRRQAHVPGGRRRPST